jgi:hypothetical protein
MLCNGQADALGGATNEGAVICRIHKLMKVIFCTNKILYTFAKLRNTKVITMKSFTFRLSYLFTLALLVVTMGAKAQWTYTVNYMQNAGNPGSIYNLSNDAPGTAGWTSCGLAASLSANAWSPAVTIPFAFDFYGTPVTQFKVSANGLLTFDASVTGTPPNANQNLPSATLPNNTICVMWDEFTSAPPIGPNDFVYYRVFGSAPNRQVWVYWYSYEIGNPSLSFQYMAAVLEETTNKVFVVDTYGNATPLMTSTVGVQLNSSSATQFGLNNIAQAGNGTSIADNDYWVFQPLLMTACAGSPSVPAITASTPFVTNTTTNVNLAFSNTIPLLSTTGLSYQWQSSLDGVNYTNIPGATGLTYSTTQSASTYYQCLVTCANGGASTASNAVLVALNPPPSVTLNSVTPISCTGSVSHTVSAEILVGSGTFTAPSSCDYTFNLVDSYGDGWNGATMQIMNGATVVATIGSGFLTGTTATQTVSLQNGISYTLVWNAAGDYPQEVGVSVVDPSGATLFNMAPVFGNPAVNTTLVTILGTCPSNAIMFSYSYDGVTYTNTSMTNTTGNTYTATIPAATPVNATVFWTISATNSFSLNTTISGSYQDSPTLGYTVTAFASPNTLCLGESIQLSAVISPSATYTDAPVSSDADEDIGNVTIISGNDTLLNNTSIYQSLVGTVGTATGIAGRYANYSALTNIPMVAGNTYGFSISSIDNPTFYNNSLAIFIDYNKDGDFVDAGEMVYQPPALINGPHTRTGTFTIPSWVFGTMRMRVVCLETNLITSYATTSPWGEREDYTITVSSGATWFAGTSSIGTGLALSQTPTATTDYTCEVMAGVCSLSSAVSTVIVNQLPSAPIATSSSQCGVGVPTASVASSAGAVGSGSFFWYDAATAGNIVQLPPYASTWSNFYTADFNTSVAAGATITGSATTSAIPGWLQLTGQVNSQQGGITVEPGVNSPAFKVEFDVQTTTGGADGFSWSFAPDASAIATAPGAEMGTGTKVKISFDAYGAMPNGAGTYLLYNNTAASFNETSVGVLGFNAATPWLGAASAHVIITINEAGELTMSIDGTDLFTNVALPAAYLTEDKSTWKHVISARTGGINMLTAIDNLTIDYKGFGVGNTTFGNSIAATTTYYVSEQGANGCFSALTPLVATVVNPNPIVLTQGLNPTICQGGTYTETATSSASPAYTYTWTANNPNSGVSAPVAGSSLSVTPVPGVYDFYITGTNGVCTAIDTVTLTVNPNPIITTATATNAICTGDTVQLAATSIVPVPTPTAVGTGTVVNGTTTWPSPYGNWYWGAKQQFLFTAAELNALNILPGNITSVGFDVTAQSTAAGFTDYTVKMGNSSVTALTTTFETGLTQVYYNAYLTPSGLGYANNTLVFQTPFTWDGTSNIVVEICFNNGSYTTNAVANQTSAFTGASHYYFEDAAGVCATVTGGTLSTNRTNMQFNASVGTNYTSMLNWLWTGLNTPGATASSVEFNTGTAPITEAYTIQATYPLTGCQTVGTTNFATINPLPVVSAGPNVLICSNNATEQQTLAGAGAATYTWNNGVIDNTPFAVGATGNYIVTGTDVNGCVNVDTMTITYSTIPVANAGIDQAICFGQTATFNATGLAPYNWSMTNYTNSGLIGAVNNSPVIVVTPTQPGTYTYQVNVSNGVGCTNTDAATLTVWALPNVNAGVDQTICNASPVIISGSGASSYTWDNGVTNATPFFPTSTATYTVVGTDVNGCQNQDQVTVSVLPQPIVLGGLDQTICAGTPIILNASTTSATPTPVTGYQWSNNVTNNTQFVPTNTGVLTVTATGANGCTNQDQILVTVLALPTVNAGQDITVCAGLSATLNASGAISYAWNNGVTQGIPFYPNATQTYTVVGTGANGCTNNDQLVVTVSTGPTVNLSAPQTVCANAPATLSAAVQNGLGGFWTTTNGTGIISPNVTNGTVTYTPNVNDPVVVNLTYVATNACGSASQNTSVTVLPIPVVNAGPDFAVCQGTSATLTATGNGFLTWTTPNVTNGVAFVPTTTATYNVVATGFNNCTNNDQVTVTVLALPDVDAGADQTICSGESVTLNGQGAVSYQWTGGASNNVSFAPATTATYTVTGTGINGCENTDQVTVVVNATPVATISVVNDVTLAASPAGMNYTWINCASGTDAPNGSTANFTAIANGSYAVIVTSAAGCSDQSDCEIIDAVGLEQIANIEMSVNPNPTAGDLTINMPTELTAQAQVFDAQGKLVLDALNVSNGSVLNLVNMTTGVYMVRITAADSVQTFRVVKQ